MRAIILAGGFGKRLQATVPHLPKPMAPINGKPFLAYLLEYLNTQGVSSVILSLHYLAETVQQYFGKHYLGMTIEYAIETNPLGTGGAIVNALNSHAVKEPVFVINGDTFIKVNYAAMYAQHKQNEAHFTLALGNVNDCSRYGNVRVENKMVLSFAEKGTNRPGFINGGVYLIQPELFARFDLPQQFSIEEFILKYLAQLKPQAFMGSDYFIDIGIPSDYARAQVELLGMVWA